MPPPLFFCPFMFSLFVSFCFLSVSLSVFLSLLLFVLLSLSISPHPLWLGIIRLLVFMDTYTSNKIHQDTKFWLPLRQGCLLVGKRLTGPSSSRITFSRKPP